MQHDGLDDKLTELLVDIAPEIATLLHTYSMVFQTPMGLPPTRDQNHAIPFHLNAKPVNVSPYWYPHCQNENIEKMVHEMLDQGIIQPSTSPFSSPIVLVKKKDGKWRFCTDYRALNAITIKDSFPMPTVDELLDELFGAKYFLSWILDRAIIKFWSSMMIDIRLLLGLIMAIMSGLLCHLDSQMH